MMVEERVSLRDQMVRQTQLALRSLVNERNAEWKAALDELRPVLRDTRTLARLVSAADDYIRELAPNLFVISTAEMTARDLGGIADAYRSAAATLDEEAPLVIVDVAEGNLTPKHHDEVSGLSVVEIGIGSVGDQVTLAHEFAHAIMRCGHRVLDEGLAEWVGTACAADDPAMAKERLRRQAEGSPPIDMLATRAWRSEPAFESVKAPPGAPHARAALAVINYVEEHGLAALKVLFRRVAEEGTSDIRSLLGLADEAITTPLPLRAAPDADEISSIRHQFRRGEAEFPPTLLEDYRRQSREAPDDRVLEEAYLKILLLEAGKADAESLRAEVDEAIELFLARDSESPLAFVLCICREAHRMRFAPDFLQLNDSFTRARALTDAAMDLHGDDIDVLSTAAKLELRTPIEYGGNPRRARNLLLRAAAVSTDPSTAAMFERAARDVAAAGGGA